MQDLLSQEEIDALLHGVDDGDVETESDIEDGSAQSYDLTSQDRIVRGRMVGREEEMAQTRRLWQQTEQGVGQLLLISGEPGMGLRFLALDRIRAAGRDRAETTRELREARGTNR